VEPEKRWHEKGNEHFSGRKGDQVKTEVTGSRQTTRGGRETLGVDWNLVKASRKKEDNKNAREKKKAVISCSNWEGTNWGQIVQSHQRNLSRKEES